MKEAVLVELNRPPVMANFGGVLTGCESGYTNPTFGISNYLRLYRDGKLRVDGLLSFRLLFDDINVELDKTRAGEVGRCNLETAS